MLQVVCTYVVLGHAADESSLPYKLAEAMYAKNPIAISKSPSSNFVRFRLFVKLSPCLHIGSEIRFIIVSCGRGR